MYSFETFFPTASALTSQVEPTSPRLGNRSTVFLNITAKDANGEIAFSTAHETVSVQEPPGPVSTFLYLPVKRRGTANRVTVYWNITSDSATFFPNDTGRQSGEVVFGEGTVHIVQCVSYRFTCIFLASSIKSSVSGEMIIHVHCK